jgi:hypothetical protein
MRHEAKIFLAILRDANSHDIDLVNVMPLLIRHLAITNDELSEVGELIKADIREKNAMYPGYGKINDLLNKLGPM